MNRIPRRVTVVLGAATAGLFSAALLPIAVAFADDYANDPGSGLDVTGTSGIPPLYAEDTGVQLYDVVDTTQSTASQYDVVGQYFAGVSDLYGPSGNLFNQEQVVVAYNSGDTLGSAPGDTPPVGSVFDTTNFGDGFENEYSDLAGQGTGGHDLITDTFVTPLGDINIPTTFDLTAIDQANDLFTSFFNTAVSDLDSLLVSIPSDIGIPSI